MDFPPSLSAKFAQSFAYDTIQNRIPRIMTKVIDTCHRHIPFCHRIFGEDGRLDAIEVVSKLSKFRNEIMTDKNFSLLEDSLIDKETWNARLKKYVEVNGQNPTYFTASWLYTECFVYRKIASILNNSKHMMNFDPFREQKLLALQQSVPALTNLAVYFKRLIKSTDCTEIEYVKQHLMDLIQISLWGNKCDLSISGGDENAQTNIDLHTNLDSFRHALLVDDSHQIWKSLDEAKSLKEVRIDIVLDNSGFELFTDLVLADFLLSFKLCSQVVFHPKPMPWFVSDVTPSDFRLTLEKLALCNVELSDLADRWALMLEKKQMILIEDEELLKFWCLPDAYCYMSEVNPLLYSFLSQSNLLIFKGDLNYRKLVGDLDWPHEITLQRALRGFTPTSLCSLRTMKADVVVGLKAGISEQLNDEDEDWMVTGKFAVIQFNDAL